MGKAGERTAAVHGADVQCVVAHGVGDLVEEAGDLLW